MSHLLLFATPDQHVEAAHFVLRGIKAVFVFIGSIIAAILCAIIAKAKGRSAILFGVLGLFFSILTLIVVLVIPSRRNQRV